ncbi:MAG: hypothetical protein RBT69_02050 [Spirochaetia bacterium]|jgi:hypothetical protein|nr:hypothetical protein [Spirochaetia bacterium]
MIKGNKIAALFLALLFQILTVNSLYAREYYLETWNSFLDLPEGLEPIEITETKATFGTSDEKIFFQIKVYPTETYSSAREIYNDVKIKIKADGEGVDYYLNDFDSVFANYSFILGEIPYQGFSVLINGKERDWVILSFCEAEIYGKNNFALLSALDSFSMDENSLYKSGPVSSFYETSYASPDMAVVSFPFEKGKIALQADKHAIEASEVTAEREAIVLSGFTAADTDAWSRFYRIIYRDNYKKLQPLFTELQRVGLKRNTDPAEISKRLLSWLQDFTYSRTGTIADFSPPLTALQDYAGDCDSLALLYVILLKYYGIDSILMVSAEYSHSMAAVDITGTGARFTFKRKSYLVAEMTEKVEIGQINAATADPAKWMGIGFN